MPPFIWVRPRGLGQTLLSLRKPEGGGGVGGVQSSQSFYRGACIPVKSRLKASGWKLRVLGRYESSLICANLKVGKKGTRHRDTTACGYDCLCLRSSSLTRLVLAETAHPRCLMNSRPMKVTKIIRNGSEERFCVLRAATAVLFPVY